MAAVHRSTMLSRVVIKRRGFVKLARWLCIVVIIDIDLPVGGACCHGVAKSY